MKEEVREFGKILDTEEDLRNLCRVIRNYVYEQRWEECDRLIPKYMELYPHSAVPHNLMGIVLEKRGRHAEAMKHFRAAGALDASYMPASFNMDIYSSFEKEGRTEPAFDWQDLEKLKEGEPAKKNFYFMKTLRTDGLGEETWY